METSSGTHALPTPAPVRVIARDERAASATAVGAASLAADLALYVVFGLYAWIDVVFLAGLALYATVGLSKTTDWILYMVAWGVGLPLALAAVWAVGRLGALAAFRPPLLAPLLVGGLIVLSLAVGAPTWPPVPPDPAAAAATPPPTMLRLLLLGLAVPAWLGLVVGGLRFDLGRGLPRQVVAGLRTASFALVPFGAVVLFLNWAPSTLPLDALLPRLAVAAVVVPTVALLARYLPAVHPRVRLAADVLGLLAVALGAAILVFDARLLSEPLHESHYLGPINDVLNGKSLLVDVNSYYGVLMVYALSLVVPLISWPLSYEALSLFNSILLCLQLVVMAALTRQLVGSIVATLAVMVVVTAIYLTDAGANPVWHVQGGPVRFGLPYLLLCLVVLRDRSPGWRRAGRIAELALLAVAALWSFETWLYVLAAYGAIEAYAAWTSRPTMRARLLDLVRRARDPLIVTAAAHVVFAVATYLRAGRWPDWLFYVDYLLVNAPSTDFPTTPIQLWAPWVFVMLTFAASTLALVVRVLWLPRAASDPTERLVAGLTAFGVLQFTYYVYRAVVPSLLGCGVVAVMLAAYWVARTWRSSLPASFRLSSLACMAMILVGIEAAQHQTLAHLYINVFGNGTVPLVQQIVAGDRDALDTFVGRIHGQPRPPDVDEATALIERYRNGAPRVAAFLITGTVTYDTLAAMKLSNLFPLTQPTMDVLTTSAPARALAFDHGLQPGAVIFVDPLTVNWAERLIVRRLCREFDLEPLEQTGRGVTALRLHAPGSLAENVWCAAHFTPFVQGPDGTVYALDEGVRRRLPDAETFRRYRGASPDLAEVRTLDADALGKIPEGPPLASAASGPIFVNDLAFVYRVTEDGLLLRYPTPQLAQARGYAPDGSNALVVQDDLARFARGPSGRTYAVMTGDPRTEALIKSYWTSPFSSRVHEIFITPSTDAPAAGAP